VQTATLLMSRKAEAKEGRRVSPRFAIEIVDCVVPSPSRELDNFHVASSALTCETWSFALDCHVFPHFTILRI
jgi:hypothetical protein